MELFDPNIKKALIFSQKNVFLIFREMEISSFKIKTFQGETFQTQKKNILKNFIYSRKWNFLSASLKNSFIFTKMNFLEKAKK